MNLALLIIWAILCLPFAYCIGRFYGYLEKYGRFLADIAAAASIGNIVASWATSTVISATLIYGNTTPDGRLEMYVIPAAIGLVYAVIAIALTAIGNKLGDKTHKERKENV